MRHFILSFLIFPCVAALASCDHGAKAPSTVSVYAYARDVEPFDWLEASDFELIEIDASQFHKDMLTPSESDLLGLDQRSWTGHVQGEPYFRQAWRGCALSAHPLDMVPFGESLVAIPADPVRVAGRAISVSDQVDVLILLTEPLPDELSAEVEADEGISSVDDHSRLRYIVEGATVGMLDRACYFSRRQSSIYPWQLGAPYRGFDGEYQTVSILATKAQAALIGHAKVTAPEGSNPFCLVLLSSRTTPSEEEEQEAKRAKWTAVELARLEASRLARSQAEAPPPSE